MGVGTANTLPVISPCCLLAQQCLPYCDQATWGLQQVSFAAIHAVVSLEIPASSPRHFVFSSPTTQSTSAASVGCSSQPLVAPGSHPQLLDEAGHKVWAAALFSSLPLAASLSTCPSLCCAQCKGFLVPGRNLVISIEKKPRGPLCVLREGALCSCLQCPLQSGPAKSPRC